jgi:diguanylate cyclase (GGDEF)-like protein/PAS domain S-box-containing protein
MESTRLNALLDHQQKILSKIALGESLNNILEDICLTIEEIMLDKSAKCSILSLAGEQLFHCAAPSMASEYCEIINGVQIGAVVGSCGTAAHFKSRVIVEDIETSSLWVNFKDIALEFNLKSCWSTPIISKQSKVLGTFAIYHDKPKVPSEKDLELIDYFVNFSSIAFEKSLNTIKVNELINDLEKSNEKFNAFTKVMPDLALIISESGVYVDSFGSSEDLLSHSANELVDKNIKDVFPKHDAKSIMAVIEKTFVSNEVQVFEYEIDTQRGRVIFEGRTAPIANYKSGVASERHVLWMTRDITVRKEAEKEVEKLAYFDPLTALPNRRLLTERLKQCVQRVKRSNKTGALLFLDIDNFKRINDSLGHVAGDELLIEVANRLTSVVRESDTLARIGGDEFVLLLEHVGEDNEQANKEVAVVAQKIIKVFTDKFQLGTLAFQVSTSIGICLIENINSTADNILKFADTAMYRAKVKGGNNYSFYDSKLQSLLENQTKLEADIIRAIDSDEFCAYFQPQVDIHGEVIGGEALIRWVHPVKGIIEPDDFIPIAEQFGLIQKLQNIVLHDICRLINQLIEADDICDSFNISINISQDQFKSSTLKTELLNIVNEFKVKPTRIKLEITETMLSHDLEHTVMQMKELQTEGFTFSIDDFGTGYSCLSYLHAYPVKELKVDKSFIDNMLNSDSGVCIVEVIINLAKNLNMLVVAEGVETTEQFNLLKEMHIDAIQGYLIAKPMPLDHYLVWHKEYVERISSQL